MKVSEDDLNVADSVVGVKGGREQDRRLLCEEMYPTVEQKTELQEGTQQWLVSDCKEQ